MDCQVLAVPEKNGGERRASIKSLMSVPGMLFCREGLSARLRLIYPELCEPTHRATVGGATLL